MYTNNTIEIFICDFFSQNVDVTKLVFQDNDESRVENSGAVFTPPKTNPKMHIFPGVS